MIGALVALLSLEVTRRLVVGGFVSSTFAVTDASNTTPIVLEFSAPHGLIRNTHAVVSNVAGNDAANGVWVMTPTDTTHVSLSTFTLQGAPIPSVGSGVYVSGGTAQAAFPDGSILLGRRNVAMNMAVTTPRVVFVPIGSATWEIDPYGGVIPAAARPSTLSDLTVEQQTMKLQRQLNTERQKFEVHVTGCANPPDPDFGDFDVTQAVYQTLYGAMFDMITAPRAKVLSGRWASQDESMGTVDIRGQKWVGVIEIAQAVTDNPLAFVPFSTDGTIVVNLANGASADETVIIIP